MKKKGKGLKALVAITALVFTLAGLEAGFRLFHIYKKDQRKNWVNFQKSLALGPHPFYPGYQGGKLSGYLYSYKPNAVWANCWPDNPDRYFDEDNCIVYRINGQGFRGHEFTRKKEKVFRIAVVGDSITFGEGVHMEDSYPQVLEDLLLAQGLPVEVLNLGVNGYGVRDEAARLKGILKEYYPDLVVWGFFINDISHRAFDAWAEDYEQGVSWRESWSHVFNFIRQRFSHKKEKEDYIAFMKQLYDNPLLWGEMSGLLINANNVVQDQGAELLFLNLADLNALDNEGYAFSGINEKVLDFCMQEGIDSLDCTEVFREHGAGNLKVHQSDAHYNARGHELVAQQMLEPVKDLVGAWQRNRNKQPL